MGLWILFKDEILMKNENIFKNIILVTVSAILSNLAYPPFNLYFINFFALSLLFYVILINRKYSFLYLSLWGIIFNLIYLYWLKIFHPLALPGVLLGIAIYYGIMGFLIQILIDRFERFSFIIVPSVWVVIEYIRSIGFLGFPWGLVAQSQWNFLSFIQLSSIFGIWIISYLVVLFNFVLANEIYQYKITSRLYLRRILIVIFIIILSVIWGKARIKSIEDKIKKSKKIKVALIQPDIDPNLDFEKIKYKVLSELTVLSEEAALYKPELIVWSETAILDYVKYYIDNKNDLIKYPYFKERIDYAENVVRLAKDLNTYLFTGIPEFERINGKELDYNSSILISPQGKIVDTYRKNHLVPFGEWFPYNISFIKKILASTFAGNFTPSKRKTIFSMNTEKVNVKFSALICYEGVFGNLTRLFVLKGAKFLLNITNDMWSFSNKAEYQHFIADVFRAVENNVPYLRSANSGVTGIILPTGRVEKVLPLFEKGYLIVNVPILKNENKTFYTKRGDFLPKILLIFILYLLFIIIINHIKENKKWRKLKNFLS